MTSSVTIRPRLMETSGLTLLWSTLVVSRIWLWSRIIEAPMLLHSPSK